VSRVSHGGESRELVAGRTLFDYADELAVEVATSCGRSGTCHECVVEVSEGLDALSQRSEAEGFLQDPYRLACQAEITADRDISFAPLRRQPRILTEAHFDETLARDPAVLRQGEDILIDGEVVDQARKRVLGIALDLGTTTVVMDIVDLETGASVETCAFANPQGFGGSDVMHRISYDEANPGELQKAVVSAINREIRNAAKRHRFPRRAIYEIVVAGNTTMRDLLFGIDVFSVGQKPYRSLVETEWRDGKRAGTALEANAWDLGFRANRQTRLYSLPLIASHVGGDTAACLAATGLDPQGDAPEMLIDIGTNTEVVVRANGRMLAASCPAGPAFEGGLVTWAMRAFDGAIESLDWRDGDFAWQTISDAPPEGFCGSGLVDLVAVLRRQELMNPLGVFSGGRKQMQIAIVPERGITFSRADGSHLAQAKAANACGQQIVLRSLGIAPEALERVTLAGGFANTLDIENAIAIGLLAPIDPARVAKVGNAALHGARKVLLSVTARRALEETVTRVEHIELETQPDFFNLFVEGCQFKPIAERPDPSLQRSAG
jgi:uncharacterized 2Fe-2S/4Fe-4S cluster protein (DUF4445 family)